MTTRLPVTVVIPVHDGFDDVRACLDSVRRHAATCRTPAELLVIDDASTDPRVVDLLDDLARQPHPLPVTVLTNEANLGFVATVNRGIGRATGDVLVLNSDTVVTAGWLDGLAEAAALPDVATVTPLTGFGSLATLPRSVVDEFALDGDAARVDECAAFVAAHTPGVRPEVITGVGFCMWMTREVIDVVGLFDEATFGRGYGEEVDHCLRAGRLGFRHLVDDTTFVHHRGGGSFGEEREARRRAASTTLRKRYRWFPDANRRERTDDPLTTTFEALRLGLTPRDPSRRHVLQVLHGPPGAVGGTEKHLHALLTALGDEFDFSILYPVESGFVVTTRWRRPDGSLVVEDHLLPGAVRWITATWDALGAEALATTLDLFDVDAVHIQNLIGHSLAPLEVLADFEGPVVCSVRDLYLACQNYSLLYRGQVACGIPDDLEVCATCLPETQGLPVEELQRFRSIVAEHLPAVDHWVFASQSAADYLARAYELDPQRVEVIGHGAIIDTGRRRDVDEGRILDEPLRLAFVGRGWAKKGLATVNLLADAVADAGIEIHHFGEMVDEPSPHLVAHGTYDNRLLPDLLELWGISIVLLPGAYAETFGHVMTEALVAGRPVIGATYGALGERIRASGAGWTIDPARPDDLIDLVRALDTDRHEVLAAARSAAAVEFPSVAATAPRYATLYRPDEGADPGKDRP